MDSREDFFVDMARGLCPTWPFHSILRREATRLELENGALPVYTLKFDGDPDLARVVVVAESGERLLEMASLVGMKVVAIPIFTLSETIHVHPQEDSPGFSNKITEAFDRLLVQERKLQEALLNCCGEGARLSLAVRTELTTRRTGYLDRNDLKITLYEDIGLAVSRNVSFEPRLFRLVSK